MRLRPPPALVIGAVALALGYGALVATGQVRAPWADPEVLQLQVGLSPEANALLNVKEGSRRAHKRDAGIPTQPPLAKVELFPEDSAWWTARCRGFFAALMRADLAVEYRLRLADDQRYFPETKGLPAEMISPNLSDPAVLDHMRRYETTLPLDPVEIRTDPLFTTDLPICLDVAAGVFPTRP